MRLTGSVGCALLLDDGEATLEGEHGVPSLPRLVRERLEHRRGPLLGGLGEGCLVCELGRHEHALRARHGNSNDGSHPEGSVSGGWWWWGMCLWGSVYIDRVGVRGRREDRIGRVVERGGRPDGGEHDVKGPTREEQPGC